MNATTMKALRRMGHVPAEQAENGLRFWLTFATANAACVAIVWLLLHS